MNESSNIYDRWTIVTRQLTLDQRVELHRKFPNCLGSGTQLIDIVTYGEKLLEISNVKVPELEF